MMPNTREKLIELLSIGHECPDGRNPFLEESCSTCPYGKAENCGAEMLADHLIANGVTVQEQNRDYHWATEQAYKNGYKDGKQKWIPVTERLPEEFEKCLVVSKSNIKTEDSYIWFVWYSPKKGFYFYDSEFGKTNITSTVTHWMPLPAPPRED